MKSDKHPREKVQQSHDLNCRLCSNYNQSIWRIIRNSEFEYLLDDKKTWFIKAGEYVYHQNDPCNNLYCIKNGLIALRKVDEFGNSLIINIVYPSGIIGYSSLFSESNHNTSAQALCDSIVCSLSYTLLQSILSCNYQLVCAFLRQLSEDVRRAEEDILNRSFQSARTKVVLFILSIAKNGNSLYKTDQREFFLPISHQDLAAFLGIRPETLARVLRSLKESGIVEFHNRIVNIPSITMLERECNRT